MIKMILMRWQEKEMNEKLKTPEIFCETIPSIQNIVIFDLPTR